MNLHPLTRLVMPALLACLTVGQAFAADEPPPRPAFEKSDPAAYGTSLAKYYETFDAGWEDSYARTTITHTNANGQSIVRKTRQMILEGKDGDKSMLRFLAPADVSGVAVLNYAHPQGADDSWLYLPANGRVRRISGSSRLASFQGTEFTYEDLSRIFVDQFAWTYMREDAVSFDGQSLPVYLLEAKPRYPSTGYSRLEIALHRDNWRIERIVFFDRAGRRLKTLSYGKWKHFHGRRWRATWMEMSNHQTLSKTQIAIEPMLLTIGRYQGEDGKQRESLKESQFTRRALEGQ